jgi:DNA processing protein
MEDIVKLQTSEVPETLFEIPQPPKVLYMRGRLPKDSDVIYLAVVGSRNYTSYGRDICEKLIAGLQGYPVVIVSGLAIGIDSIAHRAAMKAGLVTIAFPGSGLDNTVLHPKSNTALAQEIVESGGCLLSEMRPDFKAQAYSFPARNRLMAGISKAVLIIEAEEKSGTLITARMALDIRAGAIPISTSEELLEALGFEIQKESQTDEEKYADCGADEKKILTLLHESRQRDDLIRELGMQTATANALLSMMEIKELIKEELGEIRLT